MPITANISNCNIELKQFAYPFNLLNGFALIRDIATQSIYLRMQIKSDGTHNLPSGYELVSLHPKVTNGTNLSEVIWVIDGVEVDWNNFNNLPVAYTTVFAREKWVNGVLVGYDRILGYSTALIGNCLKKTLNWCGIT